MTVDVLIFRILYIYFFEIHLGMTFVNSLFSIDDMKYF